MTRCSRTSSFKLNQAALLHEMAKAHTELKSFPLRLVLDVSNFCNLRCPFCPNPQIRKGSTYKKELLSYGNFIKIMDILSEYLETIGFGDKSEPLVNKDIFRMISFASAKEITTSLSTNLGCFKTEDAQTLIDSGLDYLDVAIDGVDAYTYGKYRVNGRFDRVISALRGIIEKKKNSDSDHPYITWRYHIFRHNEAHLDEAKNLALFLGVDKFLPVKANIYNIDENYEEWSPGSDQFSNYRKDESNEHYIPMPRMDKCRQPWTSIAVAANGEVFPCCGENREGFGFGNILNDRFEDIWNSGLMVSTRRFLLGCDNTSDLKVPCSDCLSFSNAAI